MISKIWTMISLIKFQSFLEFYFSLLFLVIHSWWVSFSPSTVASYHCHHWWLFFVLFICFLPHGRVWLLIEITDYIGITCLGNHIIAIYHVCFSTSTIVSYHHHCCWLLLFVVFSLFPPHIWLWPLVGITDYIGSSPLSNHISTIYHVWFSTRKMVLYHRHRWWLLLYVIYICFPPKYDCDHKC